MTWQFLGGGLLLFHHRGPSPASPVLSSKSWIGSEVVRIHMS
jgi:hypothetical protein